MSRGVWQGADVLRRRSDAARKGAKARNAAKALHAALTDPAAPPIPAPRRGGKPLAAEDANPGALMRRALDALKAREEERRG